MDQDPKPLLQEILCLRVKEIRREGDVVTLRLEDGFAGAEVVAHSASLLIVKSPLLSPC